MELGFLVLTILMVLFAVLATYDGFYLHIIKYRLQNNFASKMEHYTHTIRAVLFPMILYFLFLAENTWFFYIGLFLVMLDVLTLGIDAYTEKDSRAFMGGLPRWEYILHLFVNGFHFASIAVFLILKVQLTAKSFEVINQFHEINSYPVFTWLIKNLIPGAILMGILHVLLNFSPFRAKWDAFLALFNRRQTKKALQ